MESYDMVTCYMWLEVFSMFLSDRVGYYKTLIRTMPSSYPQAISAFLLPLPKGSSYKATDQKGSFLKSYKKGFNQEGKNQVIE